MIDTIFILTLINTPGIGRKSAFSIIQNTKFRITRHSELLDAIKDAHLSNGRIHIPSSEQIALSFQQAESILDKSLNNSIKMISFYDEKYPEMLKSIPDPPILLHVMGQIEYLKKNNKVAIIGTREPSEYGIRAGRKLSRIFSQNEFVIVSGLAKGCDTAAHRGCLDENGITIAVLPNGLDSIYPKENKKLAEEIIEKSGCLLSEYNVGDAPQRGYFVERDRLQSGLSKAVVVIETDIKGGTMHTVDFAQKQKRLIACLSGHPLPFSNQPMTRGNKKLISEGIATPLSNSENIKNFIKLLRRENGEESMIYDKPIIDNIPETDEIGQYGLGF